MYIARYKQPLATALRLSQNAQPLFWNTSWLLAEKVFRMVVGLGVSIWLARYLGPSQLGTLSYALAFASMFSVLSTLGLSNIVVRELVKRPDEEGSIMGAAFWLKMFGGLLGTLTAGLSAVLLADHDPLTVALIVVSALGTTFSAFDVIDFWFQSKVRAKPPVIAKSFCFLAVSLFKVAALLTHASLFVFGLLGAVEIALGAVGLAIAYRYDGHSLRQWRPDTRRMHKLLTDSWPLIISSALSLIHLRLAQVMVGQLIGKEELGVYSVAVRLTEAWYFIPAAISASLFPSIMQAQTISQALLRARLQRFYNAMAFSGYAIAIPTSLLAVPLISAFYGPAYSRAAEMLTVLIWGGVFFNISVARAAFLTSMNWTSLHLIMNALGCALSLLLNLLLIPRYGGMGAVIATCLCYGAIALGSNFFFKSLAENGLMMFKALVFPKVW